MKRVVLLCILPLIAAAAFPVGPNPEKKPAHRSTKSEPWKWTLEERIEVRFDADSMRERSAAMEERNRAIRGDSPRTAQKPTPDAAPPIQQAIDGTRDPALFTPAEVFDGLLFAFYDLPDTRKQIRDAVNRELPALYVSPDEFWNSLEQIAGKYIDRNQEMFHGRGLTSRKEQNEFCAMRIDALSAARARFGDGFDRLMYVAVAPKMSSVGGSSSSNRPPARDPIRELRRKEGGCR